MSIKTIGIGGEPATGKTSLMVQIVTALGQSRELKYKLIKGSFFDDHKVALLGIYDGSLFAGTDRLSMAALPDAIAFLNKLAAKPSYDGWTVLFEGDRLFSGKFFDAALSLGKLELFLLTCDEETLKKRHCDRGDTQTASWLKGRQTKYAKLYAQYPMSLLANDSHSLQAGNFKTIMQAVCPCKANSLH